MIVVDESEPVGEIEPPFESRDVQIRRGLNVRDFFTMEEEIGRGKFGTVFKCREKKTGLRLAAKFVQAAKKADRINVEREVEIMKSLRNPRLIQLYDAFDDGKKEICLLLELIEGGELFERVIDDDFVLTERACAIFMRQICEGIQFIHLQHVLHLDMKPENILCLTREGNRIKLIDFGLARRYDPSKKLQVLFGTPEFVAPEVVNFDLIGYGTDMWSVGIIGYVLLSGLSPFMGETDVETMANVTIAKYDFDDEAFNDVSAEAKDFICKLLVKQISKRMTATESLRHPWLRPRPPLPAPPAPAGQQQDLQQQSSSPSPTPPTTPPCVDIVSSPVATPVVESIIEADVPIEAVAEQAAPPVAEISQDLVDDRSAVPDTEISDLVAEKPVPATQEIQPVPVVEETVPIVQADPALEQAESTVEQAVPVAEITNVQQVQVATELVVPVVKEVPVVEKPAPAAEKPVPVVQQKVPAAEKPVPVTKKFFPLAPKPLPPIKKPSPMFEKAVFVTRKPIAEKPVAKKPAVQQAPAVAKKPVPQAEKPIAPKNVPSENKAEKPIQIVQQPVSSATEKPVVQQAIPVPIPISQQTILVTDPATNEPVPIAAPIKPSIPPKPTSISPTKEIQPAAPPDDILQVAKVNLRQFVERWNSHPNSPFQLSSDSPRRTISLLISASPSQREASPTSLTGMSPSPPSSLPMSPTAQNQPTTVVFDSFESTEIYESTTNHVIDTNRMSVQQETTAPSSNTSVETAIEQTSALLKSVKESLIKQIESGTAVRDRTGARVWERKGSGISMGSPGPASTIIQNRSRAAQMALASNETIKSEPQQPPEEPKEEPAVAKPEADGSIEDWEIHPPVAAKTFGFAKRHKTISSVTVMTATEGMASSYSLNSSSTTTVMESHQP